MVSVPSQVAWKMPAIAESLAARQVVDDFLKSETHSAGQALQAVRPLLSPSTAKEFDALNKKRNKATHGRRRGGKFVSTLENELRNTAFLDTSEANGGCRLAVKNTFYEVANNERCPSLGAGSASAPERLQTLPFADTFEAADEFFGIETRSFGCGSTPGQLAPVLTSDLGRFAEAYVAAESLSALEAALQVVPATSPCCDGATKPLRELQANLSEPSTAATAECHDFEFIEDDTHTEHGSLTPTEIMSDFAKGLRVDDFAAVGVEEYGARVHSGYTVTLACDVAEGGSSSNEIHRLLQLVSLLLTS